MKCPFCVFMIGIFIGTTNEQCPEELEINSLTSCEGMTKYGPAVYVDFYKINRPCNCIVTPLFEGDLLVSLKKVVVHFCNTQINVQKNILFRCPMNKITSQTLNVTISQTVDVRAEYESQFTSGTFYHCLGFQQNGGENGNLSVICGSSSETTTKTTLTVSSTTVITSSVEYTSVAITEKNTEVTVSSFTVNSRVDSLSVDSTQDDPEMLYIIAGSASGGAIVLVGLVVFILILMKRSGGNKNRSSEGDMAHTNKVFDNNAELPDNPLYLSSQPMDELGYSSDQEKQLGLPPTDSKTKTKMNSNYDVPPNNKPIDHGASSMPVYAVPKRSNDRTPEVSTGDVYAEVCKPSRGTAQVPVRKRNEEGLLYTEVEQTTASTKQTNVSVIEGVCYAEIKRT